MLVKRYLHYLTYKSNNSNCGERQLYYTATCISRVLLHASQIQKYAFNRWVSQWCHVWRLHTPFYTTEVGVHAIHSFVWQASYHDYLWWRTHPGPNFMYIHKLNDDVIVQVCKSSWIKHIEITCSKTTRVLGYLWTRHHHFFVESQVHRLHLNCHILRQITTWSCPVTSHQAAQQRK